MGITNNFRLAANKASVDNTLSDVTGFSINVAIGAKIYFRFYLPITLAGTASGAKFRVVSPAATQYVETREMIDLVTATPVFFAAGTVTAAADFGATLNVAGNHIVKIEGSIIPSAAGVLKLQFAQNVTNASAATLLAGATMEVVSI